jgi:hypothetical protein
MTEKEKYLADLDETVSKLDDLIKKGKDMNFEVSTWTESSPTGKKLKLKVLSTEPVIDR